MKTFTGALLTATSVLVGAAALLPAPAAAVGFPTKPITFLVGFPAGGGNDLVARAVAREMAIDIGQPITVENKPGAGGEIAVAQMVRAPADGYTVLVGSNGALTISPTIRTNLPYNAADIEAVGMMTRVPLVLAVPGASPWNKVSDLIAAAKQNPGKLSYASSGVATNLHLTAELFLALSGTKMVHIPYGGKTQPTSDVASGLVDMVFASVSAVNPLAKSGRLKPLAVTSEQPSESFPGVPPVAEILPGFYSVSWNGLFVRSDTPGAVRENLFRSMQKALHSPRVKSVFDELGLESFELDPSQTEEYLKDETKKWKNIIEEANLKIQN